MPYPFSPSTWTILQALQTLLTNLKLSDGITPAYTTVVVGGIKEYQPQNMPYGNILARKHQSKRRHQGTGDITEKLLIEVRSVFDYSNAAAAEQSMIAVHDVLLPMLHSHATEASTQGVYHMQVVEQSGMFEWLYFKPEWYRLDLVVVEIEQYYLIQGGIQN